MLENTGQKTNYLTHYKNKTQQRKSKQHKTQNKTSLVLSPFTTLGHGNEAGLFYNAPDNHQHHTDNITMNDADILTTAYYRLTMKLTALVGDRLPSSVIHHLDPSLDHHLVAFHDHHDLSFHLHVDHHASSSLRHSAAAACRSDPARRQFHILEWIPHTGKYHSLHQQVLVTVLTRDADETLLAVNSSMLTVAIWVQL